MLCDVYAIFRDSLLVFAQSALSTNLNCLHRLTLPRLCLRLRLFKPQILRDAAGGCDSSERQAIRSMLSLWRRYRSESANTLPDSAVTRLGSSVRQFLCRCGRSAWPDAAARSAFFRSRGGVWRLRSVKASCSTFP